MSVHGSRLVPFDLTYVRYEDNDNWGQLLAGESSQMHAVKLIKWIHII